MPTYVLCTAPQKEFLVERILRDNGLDAFCPVEWRWKRIRNRHRERMQVPRPKIRGYVFLSLPGLAVGLEGVLLSRARVSYLGSHGAPQALPEGALERVIAMSERPKPRRKAYNSHGMFRVGEKVRIISDKPITDGIVEITEIRGKNAKFIIDLFNSKYEATISLDELEAA